MRASLAPPWSLRRSTMPRAASTGSNSPLRSTSKISRYSNFAYSVAQGNDIVSDQFLFGADELTYIKTISFFSITIRLSPLPPEWPTTWSGFLFSLDGNFTAAACAGASRIPGIIPFYIQFDAGIVTAVHVLEDGRVRGTSGSESGRLDLSDSQWFGNRCIRPAIRTRGRSFVLAGLKWDNSCSSVG